MKFLKIKKKEKVIKCVYCNKELGIRDRIAIPGSRFFNHYQYMCEDCRSKFWK